MPNLVIRDSLIQKGENTLSTFSSWDKCMAKNYCKWPVIVGCIVGGLIAISLIWCFIRCCMCGYRCCCCGGRRYKNRQVNNPPLNQWVGGEGAGPMPPPGGPGFQRVNTAPKEDDTPKYAYFDSEGRAANPDDLPTMPSWEGSKVEKVENPNAQESVELTNVNNAKLREGNNNSPAPQAPRIGNGYGRPTSPYQAPQQGYGQYDDGYGRHSPAPQYNQNGYPANQQHQQSNWRNDSYNNNKNNNYKNNQAPPPRAYSPGYQGYQDTGVYPGQYDGGNQYPQQGRHTPVSNNGYAQPAYNNNGGYQQQQPQDGGYFQHQPPYTNPHRGTPSPGPHQQPPRQWTNV